MFYGLLKKLEYKSEKGNYWTGNNWSSDRSKAVKYEMSECSVFKWGWTSNNDFVCVELIPKD